MAEHGTTVELFYDGDWRTVTARTDGSISLSQGAGSEGQEAPPSSATATLDNNDGNANPKNPASPLYGLVGRNTPMRVSVGGAVRSSTEVASWAPERAIKGDAKTPVVGGGLLRRLGQGKTPVRSPAIGAVPSVGSDLIAFWPLEDGSESTRAVSGLSNGDPLTLDGTTGFGQGDGLPGAPKILALGQGGGTLRAPLRDATAEFGVEFTARLPTSESSNPFVAEFMDIFLSGGTVPLMTFFANVDMNVILYNDIEFGVGPAAGTSSNVFDGVYRLFQVDFLQSGADIEVNWYVDGQLVSTETYTSETLGVPTDIVLNPNGTASNLEDMPAIGYLAVYNSATPTWPDGIPHLGYPGELAGDRFERLCSEAGINCIVVGDASDTQAMGAQPTDTLLNLLRDCVRTDSGLLFDDRESLSLVFRTGRDLYNQDPVLTLDFTGQQIVPKFQPLIDDQSTRNDVTAKKPNGSSYRAIKTSGPLNVNDPIDDPEGVGRYDTQVDVNPASDDSLIQHAHWHLHKGTVDEVRFAQITVDLDAIGITPTLRTEIDAVTIGDVIAIDNLPADWLPGQARQLVIGIRESLPPKRRLVTFITIPASIYEIGIVGANDGSTELRGQAVDTDNSTLASSVSAYATTLSVASTGGVVWTTDSDDWNPALNGGGLYIVVGGEDMRVTNISGASSPQTFTVVRSTNGVVKAHASGAPVHVRYPVRVGL